MSAEVEQFSKDHLGLTAETMRAAGYRVVDLVIERALGLSSQAVMASSAPALLAQHLGGPLPEEGGDLDDAIDTLVNIAFSYQQNGDHPRYFARVPGPANFVGILGDWLATGHNSIAASWAGGAGPSMLELAVIDWLSQLLGLPKTTDGVMVSGGSLANLTALACARRVHPDGVVYLSDQAHSCVSKGLYILGYKDEQIRVLESDCEFRMCPERLAETISTDISKGTKPGVIVGTAGTTNTGAVDNFVELSRIRDQYNMWLHVDGAYGAPAAMCDDDGLFKGLECVDSLVIDPHKWLFQPYAIGCVMVCRPGELERTFSMDPEYLRDVKSTDGSVDFRNRSPELSRGAKAAKLWLSLKCFGANRFKEAIRAGIQNGRFAEEVLRRNTSVWEIVTPANLGIVTFRKKDASDAEHASMVEQLSQSGFAAITSTQLKGRSALRLCLINPNTSEADIEKTIELLAELKV